VTTAEGSFLERVARAKVLLEPRCTARGCTDRDARPEDLVCILDGEPEAAAPLSQLQVVHRQCAAGLDGVEA
jgi:hypothetical protein